MEGAGAAKTPHGGDGDTGVFAATFRCRITNATTGCVLGRAACALSGVLVNIWCEKEELVLSLLIRIYNMSVCFFLAPCCLISIPARWNSCCKQGALSTRSATVVSPPAVPLVVCTAAVHGVRAPPRERAAEAPTSREVNIEYFIAAPFCRASTVLTMAKNGSTAAPP